MRVYDLIARKRDGHELDPAEIGFLINGYARGVVPDYQMSAWLMAICIRGMSTRETAALTEAMIASGETIDLTSVLGIKVDKHSTGGVGDKTTLVLLPLLSCAGLTVAKMSGRGLGHTGGTLDKLESIPGMSVCLDRDRFIRQLKDIGLAVTGQNESLVPADRKMYALRDVTATVESIPLIAASIMSKKIASGADVILLDVKTGSGAFMKTPEQARELARVMIDTGKRLGKRVVAAVTDMDQPLGMAIGNSLEVAEAIETLHGRGPDDLRELCVELGTILLVAAERVSSDEAKSRLVEILDSGTAAKRLKQLISSQGGDACVVDDPSLLPQAERVVGVKGVGSGYVTAINTAELGCAAMMLGAGRATKEDAIQPSAGIIVHKKPGDVLENTDAVVDLHCGPEVDLEPIRERVKRAYSIADVPPAPRPVILDVMD